MYWSDCSVPATIQTARTEDGGDRQILVSDDQHSCIVDIAIDFDSTDIFLSQCRFDIAQLNHSKMAQIFLRRHYKTL